MKGAAPHNCDRHDQREKVEPEVLTEAKCVVNGFVIGYAAVLQASSALPQKCMGKKFATSMACRNCAAPRA
jgi:hypothetical protein